MAENDPNASGEATDQSSTEAAGSGAAGTETDALTLAQRRQAGADRARDAAIAERDALQARLDAALAPKGKDDGAAGTVDVEALKRELQADFDRKLAETVAAERGKALDALYPEARKRFPEVTDAVKLAELETVFGEAPKPVGNNAAKAPGQKNIDDMSIAELRQSLDGQLAGVLGKS